MSEYEDRQTLVEMLEHVRMALSTVVHKRPDLLRPDVRHLFDEPWAEVERAIEQGKHEVTNVRWEYIEGVGLTSKQLSFKKKLFDIDIKSRIVGRIFKRINSFLGSLSRAIPVLEIVKEYKEQVEASIEDLNARH